MTYPLIRIFNADDTLFITNGNKVLQPVSCLETKSADEWYIEVECSLDYVSFISQDMIIVVPTKYGNQPFRVNNILVGSSIEFKANHIGFDTKNYIVDTLTVTGTASAILTALRGTSTNNFTSYSDISGSKTLTFTQISLYDALIDLQDAFGGYLDFDGWQLRLTATLGADRGVTVEYGKNIEEAEVAEDWSSVCTTIYPIGRDGIVLTPKTLSSAIQYDKPYQKIVDFDTDSLTTLNNLALAYLSRFDAPKINYKVKSTIQGVFLNDTVKVVARQYSLLANVLAYTYNSLTGLNESVEFGNYRRTVRGAFSAIRDTMEEISQRVIAVGDITQQQTELINSAGTYGYCTKTENEMYFHDTIPLSSAVNVLRMNVAGIGFSTTGWMGPYSTAWTIDGKFNADFIKTGTLDVARIRGDLLDISANAGLILAVGQKEDSFYKRGTDPFSTMIVNGGFDLDLSSWIALYGTCVWELGRMKAYGTVSTLRYQTRTFVSGRKYYVSFDTEVMRYVAGNIGIRFNDGVAGGGIVWQINSATTLGVHKTSSVFTMPGTSLSIFVGNMDSANIDSYFDNVIIIDLTSTFGAGSEPTVAQMDEITKRLWLDTSNNTYKSFGAGGWKPSALLKGARYSFDDTSFAITNNAGTTVFTADINGDLVISGNATFGGNINTGYDATIGQSLNMPVYVPTGTTDRLNILNNGSKGLRYGIATNKNAFITVVDNQYILSGTTGVAANEALQTRIYSNQSLEIYSAGEIRLGGYSTATYKITIGGTTYTMSRDANGFLKAT